MRWGSGAFLTESRLLRISIFYTIFFFFPGVKLHAIHFLVACVAGAKRGGRGGGRKARKRGKGREPLSPLPLSTPATQATFWARKLLLIDQKSALNYFWISIKAEKSDDYETVYVIGALSGNLPFSSTTMSAPRAITARYFPRESTRGYLARRGRLAINTRGLESMKSLLVGKNLSLKGQTGYYIFLSCWIEHWEYLSKVFPVTYGLRLQTLYRPPLDRPYSGFDDAWTCCTEAG